MRDEFPEAVKVIVSRRVGNRCSNPRCRALTSGPQEDPSKCTNIGVAAHITAAAQGGPRYSASLTTEQRKHAENAIWLCQNCAKLIDNDPLRYSEAVLREWREQAEAIATEELGKTKSVINTGNPVSRQLEQLMWRSFFISPIIPTHRQYPSYQQFTFQLVSREEDVFTFQRRSSVTLVPQLIKSIVFQGPSSQPVSLILDGRLQWLEPSEEWEYRPETPHTDEERILGFSKLSSLHDPRIRELAALFAGRKELAWAWIPRLPQLLSQGWEIVYDNDGFYFRASDRPYDQVLILKRL